MLLSEAGESGLIRYLQSKFQRGGPRVVKGIGDDTSVTVQDSDTYLLVTTDQLVEGIHFSFSYSSPHCLGRKAAAISLSDIAAMGGRPTFLLTCISLPGSTQMNFIDEFYGGLRERLEEFGVALIGGNTSSSPNAVVLGTVAIGEVAKDRVVYRSGAGIGDIVYVTGTVGDSAFARSLLEGGLEIDDDTYKDVILKHIDPAPRVEAGNTISTRGLATAMTDISDGFIADLGHILRASNVGAVIDFDRVPVSHELKEYIENDTEEITLPLTGGEDYELLFTSPPSMASAVESLSHEIGLAITEVGEIVPVSKGVTIVDDGGRRIELVREGFDHFKDI